MLADSATELDAARLLLWGAAAGDGPIGPALKLAADAALRSADRALQIHGGYGYTHEYPVARLFRDAHFAGLTA
jgi:alkylation response protein AidB-like acyl-CoA dehydrogenase